MIDAQLWLNLSEDEKVEELKRSLDLLLEIEEGRHSLSNTPEQGKLVWIKKELQEKIYQIIELENAC